MSNNYTWEDAIKEFDLNEREIKLAKALHRTPERIRANRPTKEEPWKDEPALFIRRQFDKRLSKKEHPELVNKEWQNVKKACHLDGREVRMAVRMGMTPEKVKSLGKRAALLLRRKYDAFGQKA